MRSDEGFLMRVYCVQLNIAWEDKAGNFARVRELLLGAGIEKGSLVLLPEMFATGFSMHVESIAEMEGGPTQLFLGELARELQSHVIGGVVRRGPGGKGMNRAL